MKIVNLLLLCFALCILSFAPKKQMDANVAEKRSPTPHVWQNLTPLTGGATVTACVNFVSTTDATVTNVKIFDGNCLQYVVTGTNGGAWQFTGPGYRTVNGASGFQITYTDPNGASKTVKFSGTYTASISPCGY